MVMESGRVRERSPNSAASVAATDGSARSAAGSSAAADSRDSRRDRRVRQRHDGNAAAATESESVYLNRWVGTHITERGGMWNVRNVRLEPSGIPNLWVVCEDFHYLIWKGKVPSAISQFLRRHAFFMKIACMKYDNGYIIVYASRNPTSQGHNSR